MKHPQTVVGGGMSALALIAFYAARAAGYELPGDQAIILAGGLTTVALFVGRTGVRGVARIIWRGTGE